MEANKDVIHLKYDFRTRGWRLSAEPGPTAPGRTWLSCRPVPCHTEPKLDPDQHHVHVVADGAGGYSISEARPTTPSHTNWYSFAPVMPEPEPEPESERRMSHSEASKMYAEGYAMLKAMGSLAEAGIDVLASSGSGGGACSRCGGP